MDNVIQYKFNVVDFSYLLRSFMSMKSNICFCCCYLVLILLFSSCEVEMGAATAATSVGKLTLFLDGIATILPMIGGIGCIISGIYFIYAGLTGDIELMVEGAPLIIKVVNASPGIILVVLGVIILCVKHYKVKIRD